MCPFDKGRGTQSVGKAKQISWATENDACSATVGHVDRRDTYATWGILKKIIKEN